MSVSVDHNKAYVMETLYKEAITARKRHAKIVEKACKKYWKQRGAPIVKEVTKLADFPKKEKADKKKRQ